MAMTALDQILLHLATSDAAARAATQNWESEVWVEFDSGSEWRATGPACKPGEDETTEPGQPAEQQAQKDRAHIATHSPAAILRMNAVVLELVEVVEAAPHAYRCPAEVAGERNPCTCWKSRALQRAAERLQPAPAGKEG